MTPKSLMRQLAFRFLFFRTHRNFLSVSSLVSILGLGFGVAALLVSLSVISGFYREYQKSVLSVYAHVVLTNSHGLDQSETQNFQKNIDSGMILGFAPYLYREGLAIQGEKIKGVVLQGIDFEKYQKFSHLNIEWNATPNTEKLPQVVLGKNLVQEYAHDSVLKVLFPQSISPEELGSKNIKKFFIAGTFNSGLYDYDAGLVLLDLREAQKFFHAGSFVSGIQFWVPDPEKVEPWADELKKSFSGVSDQVWTWKTYHENLFRALEVQKVIFYLFMAVLIGVAVLNVVGTLMMLFLEKRSQIAILRAMGLSWKRLRKIFLFDGLLIGSAGIILGFVLAAGIFGILQRARFIHLAPEVYFVDHVPVAYEMSNLLGVLLMAILIVVLGTLLASRKIHQLPMIQSVLESR